MEVHSCPTRRHRKWLGIICIILSKNVRVPLWKTINEETKRIEAASFLFSISRKSYFNIVFLISVLSTTFILFNIEIKPFDLLTILCFTTYMCHHWRIEISIARYSNRKETISNEMALFIWINDPFQWCSLYFTSCISIQRFYLITMHVIVRRTINMANESAGN